MHACGCLLAAVTAPQLQPSRLPALLPTCPHTNYTPCPCAPAFSMERIISSRRGKVRKISEDGKGECRKMPHLWQA